MPNKKVIGIIGAMDCEIEKLKEITENIETVKAGILTVFKGKISNHDVIIVKSGVGKANAAMCTQFIIDKYEPYCIINTGVAGGIGENLSIGDIVIGESLVQYDFDASVLGYAKGYMCTGFEKDKPTLFYSDKNLINIFEDAVKKSGSMQKIHKGTIATGDCFISDPNKKKEIKDTFNALAVEMEGAAIAQASHMNSVPCLIIRSISDLADGSATESLAEFEYNTAQISCSSVCILLENL